jgi:protoporphyrinogen/coproporphyrinogen III oxidase
MTTMGRRHFFHQGLRRGAALAATGWAIPFANVHGTLLPLAPRAEIECGPDALNVPARFDEVDNFAHAHALRDGRMPAPTQPTESCDVVIVGGGLSGLVSAWRMRERQLIVLEKETEFGGNSRSREIAGCRYALGAFLSQGPVAPFTEFFADVGAQFLPLPDAQHALWSDGVLVPDPFGGGLPKLPWPAEDRNALAAALQRMKPLLNGKRGIFFPMAQNDATMRAYDTRTQWAQYDADALPPRVRQLFDTMLSARIGDSGEKLSAWYGSYLLANLMVPSYTMVGGHGNLSRRIAERVQAVQPKALRSGFTVLRVENRGSNEVHVTGITHDGKVQTIAARCAVIAAPKHLAKHLVPGLRSTRSNVYPVFRYNAYLVAQVFLKRRVEAPYETVVPDARLARFLVAPDALPGNQRSDGGGVLTVYIPFPRVEGRVQLLAAEAQTLAGRIAADLQRVRPEAALQIEQIVLHRWGHPMLTAAPNMDAALGEARESEGRIVFAHSDNVGLTGLYSAVWAGMEAQANAEIVLS